MGQLSPSSMKMLAEVVIEMLPTETTVHPVNSNSKQDCRLLGRRLFETTKQENDPCSY